MCFQGDSDAQVTLEDQQKINKFARHNAKLQDIKEEFKQKKVPYQCEIHFSDTYITIFIVIKEEKNIFFYCALPISITHIFSTLWDKVPWIPNCNGTLCPDDAKTIGHQTCKRKICGCECEKLKVTSPIISSGTGVIKWFLIKKLLSVQFTAYKACSILTLHNTLWPLTSSKKWCLCGTDVFVNTSVFCTALRLEFSGKTMVGLSTAS